MAKYGTGDQRPRRQLTPFGTKLLELRLDSGLSQARLARMAGRSASYVALIETGERGERPSLETTLRFAQALDLPIGSPEYVSLLQAAGVISPGDLLVPASKMSFPQFVRTQTNLTPQQKDALIAVYESFPKRRRVRDE